MKPSSRPRSQKHPEAKAKSAAAGLQPQRQSVDAEASRVGVDPSPAPFYNNVMTASRLAGMTSCLRRSFWSNEIGLRKVEEDHIALRIGSAWARATEERWKGATYDEALLAAIPEGIEMDELACNTVAALLAGYYDHYGPKENLTKIQPEVQFKYPLFDGWTAEGKMDGIGQDNEDRCVIVEGKTTSERLDYDSPYWDRLKFNIQLLQYVVAARERGWDIERIIYDVCRKPTIRPKTVVELDEQGRKIVVDGTGERVFKTAKVKQVIHNGKNRKGVEKIVEVLDFDNPVQSGSTAKGWTVKKHAETPQEFSDRLWNDTIARPDYYFARREVRILDETIRLFERHREAMIKLVIHLRSTEQPTDWERDPEAWPRFIRKESCNFCPFKSFCLSGISVNPNHPPEGYTVKTLNPELDRYDASTNETTDEDSDASTAAE